MTRPCDGAASLTRRRLRAGPAPPSPPTSHPDSPHALGAGIADALKDGGAAPSGVVASRKGAFFFLFFPGNQKNGERASERRLPLFPNSRAPLPFPLPSQA